MRVKPAPGRKVRDPRSMQFLPEAGREVPDQPFWRRRIRDGDVIEEKAAAAKPAPAAATPAARG
jgi:hypothetical protein